MAEESDGKPMGNPDLIKWLETVAKEQIFRSRKRGKQRIHRPYSKQYTLEEHVQSNLRGGIPHSYVIFKKRKRLKTGNARFVNSLKKTAANRTIIHAL